MVCPDLDLAQSPGSVAMSFGNEKLARLLSQHDIAYDDRLSVCKALADVSSNAQNASRIVASQELIQSMANILKTLAWSGWNLQTIGQTPSTNGDRHSAMTQWPSLVGHGPEAMAMGQWPSWLTNSLVQSGSDYKHT